MITRTRSLNRVELPITCPHCKHEITTANIAAAKEARRRMRSQLRLKALTGWRRAGAALLPGYGIIAKPHFNEHAQ